MSRNLSINTQDRHQRKWTPSPEMAIREEDSDEDASANKPLHQQRLIEEDDEEEDDDEDEDDKEEEEELVEEDGSDFTSSPSIPDENINFDLVYTLHTFEATVDGQASVKKGDALTLLDDSNSYWWLIRDLKTSEVGYIPAENIETPFERLARLNKHRNVELTSLEQAAHYINNTTTISNKKKKKVILSTSLNVQLHVLFTGEDDDDIEEEEYEEWDEEMLDDDDDIDQDQKSITKQEEQKEDGDDEPLVSPQVEPDIDQTAINNDNATEVETVPILSSPRVEEVPVNQKVLRVFAGNIDVGASYHSVRVTENTSVEELLHYALEKFHISQIETKHGRHHGKNSCIEYYLTVKTRDGDEVTLDPQDKPYAIHESLTAHLTTPMPSLTQFRQLTMTDINTKKKKKKRSSTHLSLDQSLQFLMHKRIKRVNDKNGQVHIKVSLMTNSSALTPAPPTEKMNAIKKMTTLRFTKKKPTKKGNTANMERIDKLIAIPANISIADLTSVALVKFHIISDLDQPHQYRLILNANGKDVLLNSSQKLSEVLQDLKDKTAEKYFVLHNFSSNPNGDERPVSLSSSTSSSSTNSSAVRMVAVGSATSTSKVFPENQRHYYSHHPVTTRLDSNTEAILKRVDAALEAFEPNTQAIKKDNANPNFPSPMSVSRNEGGIDIHLPHGLLRSTVLDGQKTQYSLMKFPNTLVLQKIMPERKQPARQQRGIAVSGEEMATLVKYGTQYLDTYDTANKTHATHHPLSQNRLFVEKDAGKSLSSLEDLEKELQRIITSHSS